LVSNCVHYDTCTNQHSAGRKKPRRNDYDNAEVLPAPDSEEIEKIEPPYTPVSLTPKTPAKPVSSTKTPKSKKKLQLEEKEIDDPWFVFNVITNVHFSC
jgi:hypothetical protein